MPGSHPLVVMAVRLGPVRLARHPLHARAIGGGGRVACIAFRWRDGDGCRPAPSRQRHRQFCRDTAHIGSGWKAIRPHECPPWTDTWRRPPQSR